MRGSNRYLPGDIAVQWCRFVPDAFHSRASARGRRYAYVLLESPVRPALEAGHVGWTFRPLDGDAMRAAAGVLLGKHDFSAFRSAECQAPTPVKTLRAHRRSRAAAPTGASTSRPTPSCTTWSATSWAAWSRSAAAAAMPAWLGEVLAGAGPHAAPRRPSRPTASTSSARTTMPPMRIPERTPAMAGCPEAAAQPACSDDRAPASRSAGCRGRRTSTPRSMPAPTRSASSSIPAARAT